MVNMIVAFFGRIIQDEANDLFRGLAISSYEGYEKHINQHDVIYFDFSRMPEKVIRILTDALWDVLDIVYQKAKSKFTFVLDEWNTIFHMPF